MLSRSKKPVSEELNLTPFLNLMVILIPYLLLNAVFSQVAVLQVSMPNTGGAAGDEAKKPLVLEVMVYKDHFLVADRQTGPLKTLPVTAKGELDYKMLNEYLHSVKTQYPTITEASILLEQDTAYDKLIHTMDAVRIITSNASGKEAKYALFPDVSIGDAPPAEGGVK
jgi:biopolymer transport protein ExbD